RRDCHPLARSRDELVPADPHPQRTAQDLEALFLARVHVRRSNEPVGPHEGFDDDCASPGLSRGLPEEDPLSRNGVLDDVSSSDHGRLSRLARRRRAGATTIDVCACRLVKACLMPLRRGNKQPWSSESSARSPPSRTTASSHSAAPSSELFWRRCFSV